MIRVFLIVVILMAVLAVPAVVFADSHGAGQASGEAPPEIPAGRAMDMGYEPVKQAADDSSMALVVVGVFMIPVAGWFIARSVKRTKKS